MICIQFRPPPAGETRATVMIKVSSSRSVTAIIAFCQPNRDSGLFNPKTFRSPPYLREPRLNCRVSLSSPCSFPAFLCFPSQRNHYINYNVFIITYTLFHFFLLSWNIKLINKKNYPTKIIRIVN